MATGNVIFLSLSEHDSSESAELSKTEILFWAYLTFFGTREHLNTTATLWNTQLLHVCGDSSIRFGMLGPFGFSGTYRFSRIYSFIYIPFLLDMLISRFAHLFSLSSLINNEAREFVFWSLADNIILRCQINDIIIDAKRGRRARRGDCVCVHAYFLLSLWYNVT